MPQYLLSIYQPDGPPSAAGTLEPVMRKLHALREEMAEAGALVFTGGLHPPGTARVVRLKAGKVHVVDGPYAEAKEHVGGFWIIRAPDLDAAIEWGRKAGQAITLDGLAGLPIEVRAFQEEGGH